MLETAKISENGQVPNLQKVQKPWPKPISVSIAAMRAGVVPETIVRWCKREGIGKQLRPKAPWRVDPVGLAIVVAGDKEALEAYQAGDLNHPSIERYADAARALERQRIG
ncbi:hypothetical protein EJ074_20575 [Mesorhizobium sp. M3A.F.Ca.ET.080.04.2.1]|uniref:hypothetical protein n=1 Tax=Mesorhizobium sp. M3A.F.Ca.ET.080.04.2.1 TaxID=2493676 RepID=UPI000F763EFA|nr:hypothetical protein [Mesorhizobium sp. M3A.F.Ca.ET.080.04.2.1]AZO11216.1 hypothetical protein EJ074_20575 [Mesorhizobium sp. M3A.F.Ca.ET.080.04.2.1]RWF24883.1 MAG: hypothetical protein EOS64_06350 [Mesorhizobium sp.]